jgi:transcriptional regulator with XRE-family HTH domain
MINGERVLQARELRSMTQKELATHVGVTQAAIAQIEGGFYPASDALITAIAEKTELPWAFFERETAPSFPLGSLLFRAHAPITRRERVEAYRHAQLTYEVALFLYSRVSRITVNIQMRSEEPVEAARLTRKALGLQSDVPVPHLLNILEHHGAVVLTMPELKKRDAFSLWADGTPLLAISDGRPGDRLRMTCAHELGHLVMHSKTVFQSG